MFYVIYEFEIDKQNEHEFKEVWRRLTQVIKESNRGLGSRLHKDVSKDNIWIAYAQWPDRDTWDSSPRFSTADHVALRARMKELCLSINMVYELDMIEDLLVS